MKSLVVLFAGELTGYAFETSFNGSSAFKDSIVRSGRFPDVARILILTRNDIVKRYPDAFGKDLPSGAEYLERDSWDAISFFECISKEAEGFARVFISWADCPFLDPAFTAILHEKHVKYAAEYTFADGYPYGLCPEILDRGILPVLAKLSEGKQTAVTRNIIFDTIKKDINSFDIETDIAPTDLRHLRLELACDTKRNTMLCKSLEGITAANYGDVIKTRAESLRTLPAFYAVQIVGKCPFECAYCPYPAFCLSGKGKSPGLSATKRTDTMQLSDFSLLVKRIAEFSGDAVVSLSLWGECSFHPEIASFVECVLAYPGLSVLIETTGLGWQKSALVKMAEVVSAAVPRTNGQKPVNWIISLDAVGSGCYGLAHGINSAEADNLIREAISTTEKLQILFPGTVWPQIVRMNENEVELETFYRFWKEKYAQVIVQKHDHFCKSIIDRRVADLSPLTRNPCWHIKRDMCILLDGTVPSCKEDLYAERSYGNALADRLSDIWERTGAVYTQHTKCNYEGMCGACDEYYTYNF